MLSPPASDACPMPELRGSCEHPVSLQAILPKRLTGSAHGEPRGPCVVQMSASTTKSEGEEAKGQETSLLTPSLLPSSAPWGSPSFTLTPFQRDTGVFTAHLKSMPSCPSRAVLLSDLVLGSSPGTQETNALSKCLRCRSSCTETCLTELLQHWQPRRDTAIT